MRHLYHYHAMIQGKPGEVTHLDGMAVMEDFLQTKDQYDGLKKLIAGDGLDASRLTLASLSYHGKVESR